MSIVPYGAKAWVLVSYPRITHPQQQPWCPSLPASHAIAATAATVVLLHLRVGEGQVTFPKPKDLNTKTCSRPLQTQPCDLSPALLCPLASGTCGKAVLSARNTHSSFFLRAQPPPLLGYGRPLPSSGAECWELPGPSPPSLGSGPGQQTSAHCCYLQVWPGGATSVAPHTPILPVGCAAEKEPPRFCQRVVPEPGLNNLTVLGPPSSACSGTGPRREALCSSPPRH